MILKSLPDELMPNGGLKKILSSAAATLIVLIALTLVSSDLLERYSTNVGYKWIRDKWSLLLEQTDPVDILVLGDSSANQGIDTDYIMRKTGLTAINLATNGALITVDDYWMLEEYISRVGSPTCVIVGHVYDVWHRRLSYASVAKIPLGTTSILNKIYALDTNPINIIKFLIFRYFSPYTENKSLRAILMPWTQSAVRSMPSISESGFYAARESNSAGVRSTADQAAQFLATNPFIASRENDFALSQLVDTAKRNSIRLYLANGPVFRDVFEHRKFRDYFAGVNSFVASKLLGNSMSSLVFTRPKVYGIDQMQNTDHLIASAAEKFTESLMEELECSSDKRR